MMKVHHSLFIIHHSSFIIPMSPQLTVEEEYDGVRLDNFLTALLPDQSRSNIQRLIRDGHGSGGAAALRPSTAVRTGQTYAIDIPSPAPSVPEPEELPLRIIYQDQQVVVLDK